MQQARLATAKEADLSRASFSLESMNSSVHFDNFDHPTRTWPIELLLLWCSDTNGDTQKSLSKTVPLQNTEPIQVKNSNLNRDYSINLLPEEDPRMIVWELLHPIQQTLPALLDE
jgi:hypothetical protein